MTNLRGVIECVAGKSTQKRYVEFPLLLEKWQELKDLVRVLSIPYNATIELQKQNLTLSDTYGIWLEIKIRLQRTIGNGTSNTGLASTLLEKFIDRYDMIFANPAMKAAIYLDPRYRLSIIDDQLFVNDAKEFIADMHRRLSYLKSIGNDTDSRTTNNNSDDDFDNFDVQSEMNRYWQSQSQSQETATTSNHSSDFDAALDTFNPPQMFIKQSIIEYWESDRCETELREVAMAIFAIPPTETQVERNFSDLKQILSDRRYNLSQETLENILTIHLNKDLYLNVIEKQVHDIKNKK